MELTITTAALLLVTVVASIIFYYKIREATSEYEGAKDFVRNITFGFTRQVNRLQQDIVKNENEVTQAKMVASEALRNSGEAKDATLKGLEAVKSLQIRVDSTESEVESIRKEVQKLVLAPKQRFVVRQDVAYQEGLYFSGLEAGHLEGLHGSVTEEFAIGPALRPAEFSFSYTHHRYFAHSRS